MLADRGWHPGVIGIVAGRLAEKYHRPVVLIAWDQLGIKPGVGSARSVPGFNLHAALAACGEHLLDPRRPRRGGGPDDRRSEARGLPRRLSASTPRARSPRSSAWRAVHRRRGALERVHALGRGSDRAIGPVRAGQSPAAALRSRRDARRSAANDRFHGPAPFDASQAARHRPAGRGLRRRATGPRNWPQPAAPSTSPSAR